MKKNSFSFLELLIGLTLISSVIGILSINLPAFLKKNTFEQETERLLGHIQLAYDLVLSYDVDIEVSLYYQGNELLCELSCDQKPLLHSIQRVKKFNHIKELWVNQNQTSQALSSKQNFQGAFKFEFSYYGGLSPQSYLTLVGEQNQTSSFWLKGFPHVIKKEKKLVSAS